MLFCFSSIRQGRTLRHNGSFNYLLKFPWNFTYLRSFLFFDFAPAPLFLRVIFEGVCTLRHLKASHNFWRDIHGKLSLDRLQGFCGTHPWRGIGGTAVNGSSPLQGCAWGWLFAKPRKLKWISESTDITEEKQVSTPFSKPWANFLMSAWVGFWPSARMTVPSWDISILPSPFLSKREKVSLKSGEGKREVAKKKESIQQALS